MREICARDRREERKRREKYGKEMGRREKKYSQWTAGGQTDRKKRERDVVYRETEAVIRE